MQTSFYALKLPTSQSILIPKSSLMGFWGFGVLGFSEFCGY